MTAENQDIRWKQRFQNFDRAFLLLRSAEDIKNSALREHIDRCGLLLLDMLK